MTLTQDGVDRKGCICLNLGRRIILTVSKCPYHFNLCLCDDYSFVFNNYIFSVSQVKVFHTKYVHKFHYMLFVSFTLSINL